MDSQYVLVENILQVQVNLELAGLGLRKVPLTTVAERPLDSRGRPLAGILGLPYVRGPGLRRRSRRRGRTSRERPACRRRRSVALSVRSTPGPPWNRAPPGPQVVTPVRSDARNPVGSKNVWRIRGSNLGWSVPAQLANGERVDLVVSMSGRSLLRHELIESGAPGRGQVVLGDTLVLEDVAFEPAWAWKGAPAGELGPDAFARFRVVLNPSELRLYLAPRDADLARSRERRLARWGRDFATCAREGCVAVVPGDTAQGGGWFVRRLPSTPARLAEVVVEALDDQGRSVRLLRVTFGAQPEVWLDPSMFGADASRARSVRVADGSPHPAPCRTICFEPLRQVGREAHLLD